MERMLRGMLRRISASDDTEYARQDFVIVKAFRELLIGDKGYIVFQVQTQIGAFVEVQRGARIGARCKISSHTFICEGVILEPEVFVGHNVTFINDLYPRATNGDGQLQTEADWKCVPTRVKRGASIGSGATLLCGVTVGERALVGAGSVVTKDVPDGAVVAGNPARVIRML